MIAAYPPRDCPICGGAARRVYFHQSFAVVDQATPVTGYDVVVCERCGAGYADGIPDQAAFDRYYRDMSKYEYAQRAGAESEYDSRRLTLIADVIAPHLAAASVRILDVGCASGRLLANLRDRGFTSVTGLDPSPACAATAARLYGIDVRTMTLSTLAEAGERFDFVIMVGVLEHLRDLDHAFDHLRAILPLEGLLYVEVPDVATFADWPNAPYQDFSTEHINFFSPTSLDNLMLRHGFTRVFLEQNHREQSHKTVMSNISAVYRKTAASSTVEPRFDRDTAAGLERYIAGCAANDERLRASIDAVVDGKRRILVWGVGTHTSRLMATSRLAEADIVAFIESNSRYQGKTLHGRPILAPEALKDHPEPVLISSRVFQKEIADQIRTGLGCPNELIVLYDV
jgi:SAM-dependent methyltransferase